MIRFIIAIIATLLASIQNMLMFELGLKEMAIFAFPLSFAGIFLAEFVSIWVAYFVSRKFLSGKQWLFAAWVLAVLGVAEMVLPASYFSTYVQQAKKRSALNQIQLVNSSVEVLASDQPASRFALTYSLKFPQTAHYLTFPAYIDSREGRVFGNYFVKEHPEYYDESYVFDAGKLYSFTVVFDAEAKHLDFSKEKASIDICDSKDYFMTCRILDIGLEGVPAAFAPRPPSSAREPAVAADNVWDIAEKSIRLDGLKLKLPRNNTGRPVEFSFVITNTGEKDVAIPGANFANLISINYAWEALSESAKLTKIIPGIVRIGNAVAAGSAQFTFIRKDHLGPADKVLIEDKISPFEPFAPGDYHLHVFLYNQYSTERNVPVQELVQDFSIMP